jgi:hypothetical protein
MARRKFRSSYDGREYSDTPAGWLAASKNEWAGKLRDTGHSVRLRKINSGTYEGECRNCGGWISLGSASSSTNMRSRVLPGRNARQCRRRR